MEGEGRVGQFAWIEVAVYYDGSMFEEQFCGGEADARRSTWNRLSTKVGLVVHQTKYLPVTMATVFFNGANSEPCRMISAIVVVGFPCLGNGRMFF